MARHAGMGPPQRILVVDDDTDSRQLLSMLLGSHGYEVVEAPDGHAGLRRLFSSRPDAVLLDVVMPGMTGHELLQRIREVSSVPVLMLTARSDTSEKVSALVGGADDYVTKPYAIPELLARLQALLRRCPAKPDKPCTLVLGDGDVVIDFSSALVRVRGRPVELTATEHRLLFYLAQNAGRLLSHEQIVENVWGHDYDGQPANVRLYVHHLRHKLEPDPRKPRHILSERGRGYRLVA